MASSYKGDADGGTVEYSPGVSIRGLWFPSGAVHALITHEAERGADATAGPAAAGYGMVPERGKKVVLSGREPTTSPVVSGVGVHKGS